MATVNQIVTRAFRKMGVSGIGDTLEAEEIAEGVDALNMMIHAWALEGIQFSWTDQAASDTFALPSEYHEGVVYMLAERLNPDYTRPRTFDADKWWRAIQSSDLLVAEAAMPGDLLRMPSQYVNPKRGYLGGT